MHCWLLHTSKVLCMHGSGQTNWSCITDFLSIWSILEKRFSTTCTWKKNIYYVVPTVTDFSKLFKHVHIIIYSFGYTHVNCIHLYKLNSHYLIVHFLKPES